MIDLRVTLDMLDTGTNTPNPGGLCVRVDTQNERKPLAATYSPFLGMSKVSDNSFDVPLISTPYEREGWGILPLT